MLKEEFSTTYVPNDDYVLIGEGLVHFIYLKDNYVYKIPKTVDSPFNNTNHFLLEKILLFELSKYNIPTNQINKIYEKDELIPNLAVAEMDYINGKQFEFTGVPNACLFTVVKFIIDLLDISISISGAGDIKYCNSLITEFSSWKGYMENEYDEMCEIEKILKIKHKSFDVSMLYSHNPPMKFLLMDPNIKNFFFDDSNNIERIIDVDHPIIGDPLYQLAAFKWHQPRMYEIMFKMIDLNTKHQNIINLYEYLYALKNIKLLMELDSLDSDTISRVKALEVIQK